MIGPYGIVVTGPSSSAAPPVADPSSDAGPSSVAGSSISSTADSVAGLSSGAAAAIAADSVARFQVCVKIWNALAIRLYGVCKNVECFGGRFDGVCKNVRCFHALSAIRGSRITPLNKCCCILFAAGRQEKEEM